MTYLLEGIIQRARTLIMISSSQRRAARAANWTLLVTILLCVSIAVRIYPPIVNDLWTTPETGKPLDNHSTAESWNVIAATGKLSHLSLVFAQGSPRRVVLSWLLLYSGDIEVNPGPTKYPCTVCNRSVRENDRGILCDMCEKWTHAACGNISIDNYNLFSSQGSSQDWFCPSCIRNELPFNNTSLTSSTSPISSGSNTQSNLVAHVSKNGIKCVMLNARSIVNKTSTTLTAAM